MWTLRYHQAESWFLQHSSYTADTHTSARCISSYLIFICSEITQIDVDNDSAVLHFCIIHVVMITLCWSSQMWTIKRLWTDTRLKQIQYYFDATPRVLPGSKSYWNKNIAPYVTSKIQIAHDGIRHVIRFTVQVHNRHIQFCMLNGQCGALREPLQNYADCTFIIHNFEAWISFTSAKYTVEMPDGEKRLRMFLFFSIR